MTFNPFGGKTYSLASSIGSTDTTITLSSFLEPVSGVPYTMALLNTDIAYATISPKTTTVEFISFTGITQNADGTATLTGVTRGLAKKYPFTESSTFKLPHSGQSQFIISDAPQLFKKYGTLANDEVITGQWEAPDPLTAQGLVTRDWILALINGGTISTDSVIAQGTAGETVVAGNLLYFDTTDNEWKKTDADTAATVNSVKLGIAQGAGVDGGAISGGVLLYGLDATQTGMTQGDLMYASNTAGGISSSTGTTEKVIGIAISATQLYFDPYFYYVLTAAERTSLTSSGPVVNVYTVTANSGDNTTRFDITNPAGTTFRYTYDGTGTDPVINASTCPVGQIIQIYSPNFSSANNGTVVVTGSGANYFEITNAAGVAENDKTLATGGYLNITNQTWTKPSGLKYIVVELQGPGGSGGGAAAAGGYGGTTMFGSSAIQATSGQGGAQAGAANTAGGAGGVGTGGDINITGNAGGTQVQTNAITAEGGLGGLSFYGATYGKGGKGDSSVSGGQSASSGAGAGGYVKKTIAAASLSATYKVIVGVKATITGEDGANGVVIVTEYYS